MRHLRKVSDVAEKIGWPSVMTEDVHGSKFTSSFALTAQFFLNTFQYRQPKC